MPTMLKVLNRIVQEVSAAASLTELLDLVVERVKEALQVDACSIFLADDEAGEYVLAATIGLNRQMIGKAKVKFGRGLVGLVGAREELINLEDASVHPQFLPYPELEEQGYSAFAGVPIIYRGHVYGVLILQRIEKTSFDEEEMAFLVTVTTQLSRDISFIQAKGGLQELGLTKRKPKNKVTLLQGVAGSLGVSIGKAVVVYPLADLDAVPDQPAEDVDLEIAAIKSALQAARSDIRDLRMRSNSALAIAENALFDAYLRILDSRTLVNSVVDEINAGHWAQSALKRVINRQIIEFELLDDPYLKERAADFRDLGRRVLSHLQKNKRSAVMYPKNVILVGDDLSATAMMEVPTGCLCGVVSATGSSNSHVAILARAMGVPTVMGVVGFSLTNLAGKDIIVDGYHGQVYINPSAALKKEYRELIDEEKELDKQLDELRNVVCETKDAHPLPLYINTGLAVDSGFSLSVGAEGVGLYRTEIPFMLKDHFPGEEEQYVMYRQLLNTFAPRSVTMRTLDIGGDKQLSYFPINEVNPFLGWRGIRISLDHSDIFLQQLRALLRANYQLGNLAILLPMISSVQEVEAALCLLGQAHQELNEEGIEVEMPKIGVMVEIPAAVYQATELAQRVDFLSVGSNDLIQYILAVDRNNPRVASLYDGFHPAVLRALADVVKAGHRANRAVGLCGEIAGDPLASVLLLGMGFDSLSMNARSLLRVKKVVRSFKWDYAKQLLKEVLQMDNAKEIRAHMELVMEKANLGSLIRAGK